MVSKRAVDVRTWLGKTYRRDPVPAKDVTHVLIGNSVAEIGQGTDDAVVTPARVLSGKAADERLDFGGDAGAAG